MMVASIAGLSFIMGFFILLLFGAKTWSNHLNEQLKVYVYFDDSLNVDQINSAILKIKNEPIIDKKA